MTLCRWCGVEDWGGFGICSACRDLWALIKRKPKVADRMVKKIIATKKSHV